MWLPISTEIRSTEKQSKLRIERRCNGSKTLKNTGRANERSGIYMASNVRIPIITSIENAIFIYYSRIEIGNKDITELFGNLSSATISRLKRKAREQMAIDGVKSWTGYGVSTESAYRAWNLDINDLERRYAKLKELKLM